MPNTYPPVPQDLFEQRFGDLVALLRAEPSNDAAQDLALETCTGIANTQPIRLEAGVEVFDGMDPLSLRARMHARAIEWIQIMPGVEEEELLRLARALAHDVAPVQTSPHVTVQSVVPMRPNLSLVGDTEYSPPRDGGDRRLGADRRSLLRGVRYRGPERRRSDRRVTGERRVALVKHQSTDLQKLQERLQRAIQDGAWSTALQVSFTLLHMLPSVPFDERRRVAIQMKRLLSPAALEGMVRLALADPVEASRAATVLHWMGLPAGEAMLKVLMEAESVGPRRILYEVLGTMPAIYPMVVPYLANGSWHEVRHAAEIAGRLGNPAAIEPLKRRLNDPDERVRAAVVPALAEFPLSEVAEGIRMALSSPAPSTRLAAVEAIGRRRATAFAMPLLTVVEQEKDLEVWKSAVKSLALLGTPDAVQGLAHVALQRRKLLGGGFGVEQRLEAVRALMLVRSNATRAALERVAREGDPPVKAEAIRLLQEEMAAVS